MRKHPAFQHMNWSPGRRDLRSFAVAMLAGFGAIGCIVAYRAGGIGVSALVLWSIGAALAFAALLPPIGRMAWLAVYVPTMLVGYYLSRTLLSILFFGLFTPIGLLLRATGHDNLRLRRSQQSLWAGVPRPAGDDSYYRQV
jgi:hypothetical protein